jgi:hypothetical protein
MKLDLSNKVRPKSIGGQYQPQITYDFSGIRRADPRLDLVAHFYIFPSSWGDSLLCPSKYGGPTK